MRRDKKARKVNRAARELSLSLAQAMAALGPRPLADEPVHVARKALKKSRAALRLLRPALGEAAFRRDNARLRNAGRYLAPLRNNASLLGALEELGSRHPAALQGKAAAALSAELRARREEARRRLHGARGLDRWLQELDRSRRRAAGPLAAIGATPLRRGLRRVYRTGRKAYARALEKPAPEALHEWRKQVKYLANALAILGAAGARARSAARRADRLAESLGEHHDLSELAGLVPARSELRQLIDQRRDKLAKRALRAGEVLYRDKPREFAR